MNRTRCEAGAELLMRVTAAPVAAAALGMAQTIHFVRHGQALHNVRAEHERTAGCSYDRFIQLMKEDDSFDAELTEIGRTQARDAALHTQLPGLELIVCSPLSRAIETAHLVFAAEAERQVPFVCLESLREWNGYLVNAKRRPTAELQARWPSVDFSQVPANEESWTDALEEASSVAARGLECLRWLAHRPEREIAVVGHGGIYAAMFKDARVSDPSGLLAPRFGNCEVRTTAMRAIGEPHDAEGALFEFSGLGDAKIKMLSDDADDAERTAEPETECQSYP